MAQKKTYRLLALAVMAMVLTALFALTAFAADITGGFGTIYVPDDNNTYKAAIVTINQAGNGIDVDTANAITLTDSTDGLAGLYAVSADNFDTQTIVYVVGDAAKRSAVGEKWAAGDAVLGKADPLAADSPWIDFTKHGVVNYFAPGYFTTNATIYPQYGLMADSHFTNYFVVAFYNAESDEDKQAAVDAYAYGEDGFTEIVYRYAFTNEEITPVENVSSVNWAMNGSVVANDFVFKTYNNKVKAVVYVLGLDGKVSAYTTYANHSEQVFDGNHYYPFNFNLKDETKWENEEIATEGYLIGIEFYPFYGLTKAECFEMTYTGEEETVPSKADYRARGLIYFPSVTATLPEPSLPAAQVNGSVVSGLNTSLTYKVAPYYATGIDTANAKSIPAGTTSIDVTSNDYFGANAIGLYGIYTEGDGETVANSKPIIIYVRGSHSGRQAIHNTQTEGELEGYYTFAKAAAPGSFSYVGDWAVGSAFGTSAICSYGTHLWVEHYKPYYELATTEGVTEDELEVAFDNMIANSTIENKCIIYNFAADEIIPISEVEEYSYTVAKNMGPFAYNNQVSEFEAVIVDADGNVKSYTYQHAVANLGASVTKVVDFANKNSLHGTWIDKLPEEGYLIAFNYNIYANLDNHENAVLGSGVNTGTRYSITPNTSYVIKKPAYEAPKGVVLDGTTLTNLDSDKKYAYAPYYANSTGTAVTIPENSTSFELPADTVGLIGLYYVADEAEYTPTPAIFYIRPSYAERSALHERDSSGYFKVGAGIEPGMINGRDAATNAAFGKNAVCTTGDHVSYTKVKTLYDALNSETATKSDKETAFNDVVSTLGSVYYHYEFTQNEIVPISEVNKYSYLVNYNRGNFGYSDHRSRFDVEIMDANGKVSTYTYLHDADALPMGGEGQAQYVFSAKTVDFNSEDNWQTALPEEGYLVGLTVYPYYGLTDYTKASVDDDTTSGTRYSVVFANVYDIDRYLEEADKDIVANGATFSGLDANETYTVAPFNALGAGTPIATDITGTTTYTITGDTVVGLYGIYPTNNENVAPVLTYVQGSFDERGTLGTATPTIATSHDPEFTKTVETAVKWTPGTHLGARWYSSAFSTHDARYTDGSLQLLNALNSEDANRILLEKRKFANAMKNVNVRYAYTADEIVPISQVVSMTVGSKNFRAKVTTSAKPKLELYVMQPDGNIAVYSWIGDNVPANSDSWSNQTVYVQKDIPGLPEEGWLVGYRFTPIAEADLASMTTSSTTNGAEFAIYMKAPAAAFAGSYEITLPKAERPTGITFENNTISGLTSGYVLAPFTANGAGTPVEFTGDSYTFNPETEAGLWGVYVPATENYFSASDPVIVYVEGAFADRQDIGEHTIATIEGVERDGYVTYSGNADYGTEWSNYSLVWYPGLFSGYRNYYNSTHNYFFFSNDWSARGKYTAADLKAALETEDTSDELVIRQALQALATKQTLRYSYLPEEVVPVDELLEVSFGAFRGHGQVTVQANMMFKVYVMDDHGVITPYTWVSDNKYDYSSASQLTAHINVQDIEGLPSEGWVVGYEYLPAGNVALEDITSTSTSTNKGIEFSVIPLAYTIKEDDHIDFGMSLVLDGKVGVKVTATADETVLGYAITRVEGTDNYVDFGENDYAIFYVDPKDVATAEITFDVTYVDAEGEAVETYTITVADYIDALLATEIDDETRALVTAFDTYYKAAAAYFDGVDADENTVALDNLSAAELADLASKTHRARVETDDVANNLGLSFHSTSLLLEDNTTIRHYFKVTGSEESTNEEILEALAIYTVEGGSALALATSTSDTKYAYTDVVGLPSNALSGPNVVTVMFADAIDDNASITVTFAALDYVGLSLNDADVELQNLVKALYRYSVASDNYNA